MLFFIPSVWLIFPTVLEYRENDVGHLSGYFDYGLLRFHGLLVSGIGHSQSVISVDGYPCSLYDHRPRCLLPRKVFSPLAVSLHCYDRSVSGRDNWRTGSRYGISSHRRFLSVCTWLHLHLCRVSTSEARNCSCTCRSAQAFVWILSHPRVSGVSSPPA